MMLVAYIEQFFQTASGSPNGAGLASVGILLEAGDVRRPRRPSKYSQLGFQISIFRPTAILKYPSHPFDPPHEKLTFVLKYESYRIGSGSAKQRGVKA